jgi:hypothetical protein
MRWEIPPIARCNSPKRIRRSPIADRHQKQNGPFVADPPQNISDPSAIRVKVLWFSD